jgi:uncharacterized repeat protein (TIGR03803 family)
MEFFQFKMLNRVHLILASAVVAAVSARAVVLTPLYTFQDGADGAVPSSGVTLGTDGNYYGAALNGGANGWGTLFRVTPSGAFTALYSFTGAADGATPNGLMADGHGDFFGTTANGGANTNGALFEWTAAGAVLPLYSFSTGATNAGGILTNFDGATPSSALVSGANGNLYGVASAGGLTGNGAIFQITSGGSFVAAYSFTNGLDGASPSAALVSADGNFYGTAMAGGAGNSGTIFQFTPGGNFSVLYAFTNGLDGGSPQAALVAAPSGTLYGVAIQGGSNGNGTIFAITTAGNFTALYSFSALSSSGTNSDGANPSVLTVGRDGNLYGAAANGGANGSGSLFEITPADAFATLYSFTAQPNADGANPSGLLQVPDGYFYGTAAGGGTNDEGTVFSFNATFGLAIQLTNGLATLYLTGLSGQQAIVQASTNLLQWAAILTNPPTTGSAQLVDTNAAAYPRRFYRAHSP